MFKWNLDGTVENLKNPFKVDSVKTQFISMHYLNNLFIHWIVKILKNEKNEN